MKLPPLENLRIFTSVVRLHGFSAAAEQLALSHSAVSRRVSELEARLGVQLLQRTSRQLSLTPAGKILYEAAEEALRTIETATAEILSPGYTRPLLVSCERSLAMRWLIPRLSSFQDANPAIPVYLSSGGGIIDLQRENIDIAIRRADFAIDRRYHSIPLFAEYVGPVHAPTTRNPANTRLHSTGRADAWNFWLKRADSKRQGKPGADQYFDHFFLSLQAAEAGLGSAIAPLFLAIDSLLSNRLAGTERFIADGTQYLALLREPPQEHSAQALFMQWLQTAVNTTLAQAENWLPAPGTAKKTAMTKQND